MKFETLFWIVIVGLIFIGLISFMIILKRHGEAPKIIKFGKFLLTSIGVLLFYISYFPDRTNYHLEFESSDCEEYDVPQIDTHMFLSRWFNGKQTYASRNTDSIRHDLKIVEYDMFDIYKIEDLFINKIENLELVMTYVKPNIIRGEKRLNILQKRYGQTTEQIDTLNLSQAKKVLKSWGFTEELFKYDIERYLGK